MRADSARRLVNLRALISHNRRAPESLAWMTGLLLAPTALRAAVDTSGLGLPFLTYWPCLLIASLLLEVRYAIVFAFVAAIVSQRIFGGGAWFAVVTPVRVVYFMLFALSAGLIVAMGASLRCTMREIGRVNDEQENYNRELRHRVRNMLNLIQALASRGPRAESPLDFYKEFSLRLDGLAKASDLLQIGATTEGRLPDLARDTVAPFDGEGRIRMSGEPCLLPAGSAIPLIMSLHELATNAIKHGALSVPEGFVELSWFIGPNGTTLFVLWTERRGPRVEPPVRKGLGTRLLMPQPGIEAIELNFDPAGLWCEMRLEGARAADR
ncbi:two-component sensor histidine kinase [Novosphingobium hassiacum]|uniref:histidine kinase n=1 Tax=Novosphingobium hassiacum TaxID=173676 RepID=A0A7W6EUN7_9SPHN|nr:two-component sensor histidine kinase [Novosphingobium hassiacum]